MTIYGLYLPVILTQRALQNLSKLYVSLSGGRPKKVQSKMAQVASQ